MSPATDTDVRTRRRTDRRRRPPGMTPERARTLLVVALRPGIVALTLVASVVVVTLVAASSDLTGTFGAIAATWLAVHQVPVTIGGATLGILPLLPTIGLCWLVARTCGRACGDRIQLRELGDLREFGWIVGAAVAGPLLLTLMALAVVGDASQVIALEPPNPLAALGWVLVVHLVGAVGGLFHAHWRQLAATTGAPDWAVAGWFAAAGAVRRLMSAALVVTVLSLLLHGGTVLDAFRATDGITGWFGVLVLSLAYLPNVVIATAAVLCGAPVHVGAGSVSLFGVVGTDVPAFPALGALPTGPAQPWWAAALAVPIVVGGYLGRDSARACAHRWSAAQAALAAGLVIGVGAAVMAAVSGGTLGAFGRLGAQPLWFGLLAFAWIGAIGAAVALVLGHRRPHGAPDAAAGDDGSTDDGLPLGSRGTSGSPRVIAVPTPVDAELIGEPPTDRHELDAPTEIIDAEVEEADLPDGSDKAGR